MATPAPGGVVTFIVLGILAGLAVIVGGAAWYVIAPFKERLDRMYEQ